MCALAECAICRRPDTADVCAALSLSRGGSLTYHKIYILKVIKKVIQDHQTEKSHHLYALAECAICGQPDTTHHSLTGIKGPDEETRKEQNTVLYVCTHILLPELSIIFAAVKTIFKSYGLVVDVQTASERRRFFNSRHTFYD